MNNLLEVSDLSVALHTRAGTKALLDGVHFTLREGEILGLVGESGSGKSLTALTLMGLLPTGIRVSGGHILYGGENLLTLSENERRQLRGASMGMVFQEPMTSLNPVFTCGEQVEEGIMWHRGLKAEEAKSQVLELFRRVQLRDEARIYAAYPHQLSGGQKQRVMIAMALSGQPRLLIADEPTTALDVTVQKTILDLLRHLHEAEGLSTLFISHDLGVVGQLCHRVAVMQQGTIVEEGTVEQVLKDPRHPYTQGLLHCRPSLHHQYHRLPSIGQQADVPVSPPRIVTLEETAQRRAKLYSAPPILQVQDLQVRFPKQKNWLGMPTDWVLAVDRVSFEVHPGETFGIAGESGCGKTTLARALACLQQAYSGEVLFTPVHAPAPVRLLHLKAEELRPLRRQFQVIFQDPAGSLHPRMRVGAAIEEPMRVHGLATTAAECMDRAFELLHLVGLEAEYAERFPHELSGGQRQRVCIARALAVQPRLLICDECVSSLDVSIQATVLNLLQDLQEKLGLTYLFISHDLSVIRQMCDRVMVMQAGQVVALGYPEDLLERPEHPYVKSLVEAVPGG